MIRMTFEEAVLGIMDALTEAGFENVSTSATLSDEYGELSFFGDEAERLLRIIRLGLSDEPRCSFCGNPVAPGTVHTQRFSSATCELIPAGPIRPA